MQPLIYGNFCMSPNKRFTKPNITPLKNCDFLQFLSITQVWDVIETWGFCVDDPCDFPYIPISPQKKLPNLTYQIFQWS